MLILDNGNDCHSLKRKDVIIMQMEKEYMKTGGETPPQ